MDIWIYAITQQDESREFTGMHLFASELAAIRYINGLINEHNEEEREYCEDYPGEEPDIVALLPEDQALPHKIEVGFYTYEVERHCILDENDKPINASYFAR